MNTPLYASASLYVGDLANDVTEALLFELFNPVGPVASIRVCRDAVTRRSLGYAYVNFHNVVDAERALDTMNYCNIKDRPCRIMWSHRDPSIRKSGVGNVFIKNLDKSIDHKALYDTFSAFGNILSCKVMTDEKNQSLGYGFVHYETQEAAEQAISKVNGMLLNLKQVYVGPFVPRKQWRSKGEAKFTNIYVKNVAETVDEDALKTFFEVVGPVVNAIIMRNEEGKSKGFGFVNFKNPEDAKRAVEDAKERELEGKTMTCCRAQKRAEREAELKKKFEALKQERLNSYQGVNLYVKNLDDTVTDEQLLSEFTPFGPISSAKVMRDEAKVSKGFGFVCYKSPEEATKAVTEMNGRMLGTKPIYVALAQRKEIRKAQLEAQHAQRSSGINNMGRMPQGGMGYMPAGQPVYYPGQMPPQGQRGGPGGFMYPQMVPRPRWQGQPGQGPQQQQMPRGYGGPQQPGGYVMQPGMQNQQGGRGNQRHQGGRGGQRGPNQQQQGGQGQGQSQGQAMPAPAPTGNEPLTSNILVQATPQEQKQILGEKLYPEIAKQQPALAGKITGMLLEMDNTELLNLLESPDDLTEKVNEAVTVLENHQKQQEGEGAN